MYISMQCTGANTPSFSTPKLQRAHGRHMTDTAMATGANMWPLASAENTQIRS